MSLDCHLKQKPTPLTTSEVYDTNSNHVSIHIHKNPSPSVHFLIIQPIFPIN